MPKKIERYPPVFYVTRETFLVQFLGPTEALLQFCRTFGRTITVTSGVSKKVLKNKMKKHPRKAPTEKKES